MHRRVLESFRFLFLLILGTQSFIVGCGDPRISMEEFLALQERMVIDSAKPPEPPKQNYAVDRALVPYRIGPGDVLAVSMTGLEQATVTTVVRVRVDRNGEIDLPLVGTIKVGWHELADAEDKIKDAYVPNIVRQLTVTIDVTDFEPTTVLVRGSVQTPGLIQLRRTDRNLLSAVMAAGGGIDAASGQVTLHRIRQPGEPQTFNLFDPVELDEALAIDPLENGDILIVDRAPSNTIYVGGLVNTPAPQSYETGAEVNVLQVIAAARGLRTEVFPTEGTLIRRMPDGSDVQVKLRLDRIQRGEDENITLAAGDILWVPDTFGTKAIDFFNRNFFFRGGVSITYSATGIEFLNSNAEASQFGAGAQSPESQFDPFGFLLRNTALQGIQAR